ncbi:PepSY-associated TM helix domain-containing protein [Haliangium sp.]|uniref:PepSY-associated TM helix domain-containing protein n=1 Tax=Haliangium sp. TaxID=2663208 RepID=UPI003D0FAEFA
MTSVKAWFLVHKWTSLVCTPFLLLLCLTGLPLIFSHEIDHLLGRSVAAPSGEVTGGPVSLDHILSEAQARSPEGVVQFVVRDPDQPDLIFVRLGESIDAAEALAFYTYDVRTGAFLHEYPLREGVMNVILRLHVDLFAGLPGTLLLGVMGLLLVASIVSGVVLYGPYMRKLAFGTVRRRRSVRIRWLDLHNLLGVVTLVWLLAVGATGVVNTLAIPIFGHWQATELAAMIAPHRQPAPTEPGSAERALAAARAEAPDLQMSFMAFPGNGFAGPHHYVAYMQGTTPWTSKLLTPLLIDGRSGEVVARRDLPWYVSALLVSQPLHFGDYGGVPLKLLWALLDLLSIVVLASGTYLWWKRRRVSFDAWVQMVQARTGEVVPT